MRRQGEVSPLAETWLILHPQQEKSSPVGSSTKFQFSYQSVIPPLNNSFHVNPTKKSFLAVIIATVQSLFNFIYTLYTLISILVDSQYLQNVGFNFEKGLYGQNLLPIRFLPLYKKSSPAAKFPNVHLPLLPPPTTKGISLYPLTLFGKPCQMWNDHLFRQRNKATKRAMWVDFDREGGLEKIRKKASRQ